MVDGQRRLEAVDIIEHTTEEAVAEGREDL
jgi:hypothetical protein